MGLVFGVLGFFLIQLKKHFHCNKNNVKTVPSLFENDYEIYISLVI